jgi:hypothetical protein
MKQHPLGRYEKASGFIRDWNITGFFPNATRHNPAPNLFDAKESDFWTRDYLAPLGGESSIRQLPAPEGIAALEWLPVSLRGENPKFFLQDYLLSHPELAAAFPGEPAWNHQWYALALIDNDTPQDAEIRLCGQDGCRVWWNGRFVLDEHSWHKLAFDLHIVPVRLKKGRNSLLVKLDRYGLVARLTAPRGKPLKGSVSTFSPASGIRVNPHGTCDQLARYAGTLRVTMPCRARTRTQFFAWKRTALAHFHQCLGPFPELPSRCPAPDVVEITPANGYTRYRYHLHREAGSILPVHVLIPNQDRFNGRTLICPHGHAQDDKVVIGAAPPPKPFGNFCGQFTGNYAERLAQDGFITAAWSERGLSRERNDFHGAQDPCAIAGLRASAMGLSLPGLHLFDLHGVADLVSSLPGVNPGRLGLIGLSGGGTLTCLAAAFNDRFKAMAIVCGLLSYSDYSVGHGCAMQIVPRLYPTLDTGDLLCLAAPRPLFLSQGRRDVSFDIFRLERFASEAGRAYRLFGMADRVETHLHNDAHQIDIEAACRFFLRRL